MLPSITIVSSNWFIIETLRDKLIKLLSSSLFTIRVGLLSIVTEWARTRLDHEVEQIFVVDSEESCMQKYLNNAYKVAEAASLVNLIALATLLLSSYFNGCCAIVL